MGDRRSSRAAWVSPVLVQKSIEETRAGIGNLGDGAFNMEVQGGLQTTTTLQS